MGDDEFAAVMMHEIGHFLGLGHTTTATIMKQGEDCASPAGATNVTASDAQDVADCFPGFCTSLHATPTPTPTGSGPCLDHYRFVAIYNSEGDITGYRSEWAGCY
ncbi:MAG: M48 family metalloprotease [Pyrinomonadaceae bacterium]|nr:M48 family metalloprotease [Pyrinomonadaceae bacterium]